MKRLGLLPQTHRPLVGAVALALVLSSCSLIGRSRDLEQRIGAARTPRDHAEIAELYLKKAEESEATALQHLRLAASYEHATEPSVGFETYQGRRKNDAAYLRMAAKHCRVLSEDLQRTAGEFRELARLHGQLARLSAEDTQERVQ